MEAKGTTPPRAQMWATYDFRGFRVMVIQQWQDPFGRPMVRIQTLDETMAEGMPEELFLKDAKVVSNAA